jgi:hypothetical protein
MRAQRTGGHVTNHALAERADRTRTDEKRLSGLRLSLNLRPGVPDCQLRKLSASGRARGSRRKYRDSDFVLASTAVAAEPTRGHRLAEGWITWLAGSAILDQEPMTGLWHFVVQIDWC